MAWTRNRVLALVGAGSVRSPLFLQAAWRRGFRGEVRLFDRDPGRLALMTHVGLSLLEREGAGPDGMRVQDARSLEEAVSGADAVVAAIRPGGLERRARDEEQAFSLGLIGQETVGVCGIAMAWRTLPDLIEIAEAAGRLGNDAWLLNFTNPVGITSLGLWLAGFPRTAGICDSANQALYAVCRTLGLAPDGVEPETFGLNHLSWTRAVRRDGKDLLAGLLRDRDFLQRFQGLFEDPLIRPSGLFLNEYLYYYLRPERAFARMEAWRPHRGRWLAAEERKLLAALEHAREKGRPEGLAGCFADYHERRSETYMAYARQGRVGPPSGETAGAEGYAGVALDLWEAMQGATERVRAVVLPCAAPPGGLPGGVGLEMSWRIGGARREPVVRQPVPPDCLRLIEAVGACERLVAESVLESSPDKLRRALEGHPLVGPEKAGACVRGFAWRWPDALSRQDV